MDWGDHFPDKVEYFEFTSKAPLLEVYKEVPLTFEVIPDDENLALYFAAKPLPLAKCSSQALCLFLKPLSSWRVTLEVNLRAGTDVALSQIRVRASKFVTSRSPHSHKHTAQDLVHMIGNTSIADTLALDACKHRFTHVLNLALQAKVKLLNQTPGMFGRLTNYD